MRRNNTDSMDTMEFPAIRPEAQSQDGYYYDGSYDYYNDPKRRRYSPTIEQHVRRRKSQNKSKANSTQARHHNHTGSSRRANHGARPNRANDNVAAKTVDGTAMIAVFLAIFLVAVFAAIFCLIMNGFKTRNTNSPNQQSPNPPAFETYIETTQATVATIETKTTTLATEAQTTETTTTEETETTTQTEPQTTESATDPATRTTEALVITDPTIEPVETTEATSLTDPAMPTEEQEPETQEPATWEIPEAEPWDQPEQNTTNSLHDVIEQVLQNP